MTAAKSSRAVSAATAAALVWLALLTDALAGQESLAAVEPNRASAFTARAVRIAESPEVDGVLDESFWQDIEPITEFVQREPLDGGSPTERTEVRIAYDDRALYFAFKLFDSEPDKIRRSILHREGRIDQDDRIVIALDTYNDDRNGYLFELNALGTQGDALFSDERQTLADWNWEGVYYSQGRVTEDGWLLEVAVPFTTIRFERSEEPTMGIAIYRSIRRKNEEVYWPHISQRYRSGIVQASQYATLTGLEGINPGRHIQIIPFAVAGAQKLGSATTRTERDIGIDAKYSITPNLTLDLTYNTDFAQVESDNVQINLTRFSLFFPEKRPFFLERANLFALGDPQQTEVFFSRRIGLVNEIVGGGRLTGQLGPLSVGFLSLQTDDGQVTPGDETTRIAGANNSVLRIQGELLPRTTVGMIATNLQNSDSWNRSWGVDVRARFWGSSQLGGWFADTHSSTELPGGSAATSLSLSIRPTRLWAIDAGYTDIGEDFVPALGFVRRRDMVRYSGGASLVPRFDGSRWARQLVLASNIAYLEGQDGRRQSVDALLLHSMLGFQSGDYVSLNFYHEAEALDVPFPIRSDAEIPEGSYDWRTVTASAGFNESRTLSGGARVSLGGFYSGDRTQYGANLNWKTGKHLTLSGSVDKNEISLPIENGDFSTTILGLNVLGAVSRALFANALIQYDTDSETLQSNIRINWIHRPGSNLFVVFDTGYDVRDRLDDPRATRWVRRTGVVKLTWLQAF